MECSLQNGIKSEIHLKEDVSSDLWEMMLEDAALAMNSFIAKKEWVGEYEFDKLDNDSSGKKYEIIMGKRVQNIKLGGD